MFKINRTDNRITKLPQQKFSELKFRERQNFQEWLVHEPSALGEELLFIQKEFDGFDETRERLDLLALDKNGRLIVIENKLDDSGRDVIWQAIKYAAYISTLKAADIVRLYQQYLNQHRAGESADRNLCDFLEVEDLQDIKLNASNTQRIGLIAVNFRREVTAAVMWLRGKGLQIQCFRATPYGSDDDLFLDLQQIIPPPEAADYMVNISRKDEEDAEAQDMQHRRHDLRLRFWTKTLEALRKDGVNVFANVNPSRDHWLSAGSGIGLCPFIMVCSHKEARVEMSLIHSDATENKRIFDHLHSKREAIERAFGHKLDWKRLDSRKASRIVYAQAFDGYNEEAWPEVIAWLSQHIRLLVDALKEPLRVAARSAGMSEDKVSED